MKISAVFIVGAVLLLQQCSPSLAGKKNKSAKSEEDHDHHDESGTAMVGVTLENEMAVREEDGTWTTVPNSCCVTHVTGMRNGVVLGLKEDGYLYEWKSRGGVWNWVGPSISATKVKSLSIGSTGILIATDAKNRIVAKSRLENEWTTLQNPCCVTSVTAGPNGVTMGVTKSGTLKKRLSLITGTWKTCRVKGPKMKQLISYPSGDVLGLTKDGCGIYNLLFEEKQWNVDINAESGVCFTSVGILMDPNLGIDLDL